jgi:hypothetical protein
MRRAGGRRTNNFSATFQAGCVIIRDPEFEQWKAEFSRPGRLTAALNTYRANFKYLKADVAAKMHEAPVRA